MELQISVRDDKAELFLNILKEFKEDMVEKFTILDSSVSDAEQKDIEKILESRSEEEREVSHSKIVKL